MSQDTGTPEDMTAVWWMVGVAIVVISALIGWSLRRYRSRHTIPETMDEVENNPFYRGDKLCNVYWFYFNFVLFQ